MEIKNYLELCQKCAIIEKRINGMINNIPQESIVSYLGNSYYPLKYEIYFDKNGVPQHTAILHDLYANSIIYADLKKVEKRNEQTRNNPIN